MRTPPSIDYCGLTILLDEPSRFDLDSGHLLAGPAGSFIQETLNTSVDSMDIRTVDYSEPLMPDTRYLAVLGNKAAHRYNSIGNDPPGYPLTFFPFPATTAFDPQSCCDYKRFSLDAEAEDEDEGSDRDTKEVQPTRFKNYRFWTKWHLRKLVSPIRYEPPLVYKPYPSVKEITTLLDNTTNEDLLLDIETSRYHRCLTCIGISTSRTWPTVYVIPVYTYDGSLAYDNFQLIHRSLGLALCRNQVVIHNASFDLLVLVGWYGFIPPTIHGGSVYDTMVANHRIAPEVEKSLAHVISMWTNQGSHKDTNTEVFHKGDQDKLWLYNAKDVYNLKLIKDAQLEYASSDEGLMASIRQANESIMPYILNSLTGLPLDLMKLSDTAEVLNKKKMAMERIASTLVGSVFNPGSSKQCAKFFHDTLHYPIVSRTANGAPALRKKQLYQLMLKHDNPLIPVVIKYREAAKDLSMLESELL